MRRWRTLYRELPSSYDWSPTLARRRGGDALARLAGEKWPSVSLVANGRARRDAVRRSRRRGGHDGQQPRTKWTAFNAIAERLDTADATRAGPTGCNVPSRTQRSSNARSRCCARPERTLTTSDAKAGASAWTSDARHRAQSCHLRASRSREQPRSRHAATGSGGVEGTAPSTGRIFFSGLRVVPARAVAMRKGV